MLRSLGLVLIGVVALWFFGQPSPSDEKVVRTVDQREDISAWTGAVHRAPVPVAPAGWRPTVSQYLQAPVGLRLGWNTASGRYTEFAATTGPAAPFVQAQTGGGPAQGTTDAGGHTWERYVDRDGSVSLVRQLDGGITVVVGTSRENAPEGEVVQLAESVR
jgi:hypothetical protein